MSRTEEAEAFWRKVLTDALDKGLTAQDIAAQEYYSLNAIRSWSRKLNIPLTTKRRVYSKTVMWDKRIEEIKRYNLTRNEALSRFGCTAATLADNCRKRGIHFDGFGLWREGKALR